MFNPVKRSYVVVCVYMCDCLKVIATLRLHVTDCQFAHSTFNEEKCSQSFTEANRPLISIWKEKVCLVEFSKKKQQINKCQSAKNVYRRCGGTSFAQYVSLFIVVVVTNTVAAIEKLMDAGSAERYTCSPGRPMFKYVCVCVCEVHQP